MSGYYVACNHGIEIKSLRSQVRSAKAEIEAMQNIHQLEVESNEKLIKQQQELAKGKENLLQDVIINFKKLRRSM